MKLDRIYKIFLAVFLAVSIGAGFAHAEGGIQISPLTFNYDITPGTTQTGTITLRNLESEELNYVMEVELFNKISDEGAPSFQQADSSAGVTTIADWINFPGGKEGKIAPQQAVDINFNVDVPSGAEPGGHYAAIFAKQLKKDAQGKTQLGVVTRVGSLVLVSIPGDVDKSVSINEFNPKKFVWYGPVSLTGKVTNTGTVHYDSQLKVDIKSLFGKTTTVDLGKHTLIPDNERNYKGTWENKYPFGYYKLTASASDGDGNFSATKQASVIAIPLIIVIPIILVILIVFWATRSFKKHFKLVKNDSENNENLPQ